MTHVIVDDEVVKLPSDDVYLEGWNMSVTIDFSLKGDIEPEQIELELIREGSQIEVLKDTQSKPIARIELPHPCDDVIDWSLNNGILDITLKLTPQGSALDDHDDETPQSSDIAIDLGDDDDLDLDLDLDDDLDLGDLDLDDDNDLDDLDIDFGADLDLDDDLDLDTDLD